MAQRFLQDPAALGVGYPIIGNNSVALAVGDAVTINGGGFLDIASTSGKILGYCLEAVTMASDNETVAKVCPKYTYAEDVLMVYPTDEAVTQTSVGQYADFSSATTNAQTLNLVAGATGQFLVIGFDPTGDGTTTDAVVIAAERIKDGYAQS
jgi:hypothetical protein